MFKKTMKLMALAAMAIACTQVAAAECYSSGVRVGTIQKFSSKGLINKSGEGQLVQDGVRASGQAGITNVWRFSVTDPAVASKIEALSFEGKPVALKYCQSALRNPLATDTKYTVTDAAAR